LSDIGGESKEGGQKGANKPRFWSSDETKDVFKRQVGEGPPCEGEKIAHRLLKGGVQTTS